MAHFAKLDENNIVLEVYVVSNAALDASNEETSGIVFLTEWSGGYPNWKQTSYNATIRKNYASIGMIYDAERNAFYVPQPYPSWTLDEDTCLWEAPTPMPIDGKPYKWIEEDLNWEEII